MYGIADFVEFISLGIAHIPPEYMFAGLGIVGVVNIPAALTVAGIYTGSVYGPDALRVIADWIDPD